MQENNKPDLVCVEKLNIHFSHLGKLTHAVKDVSFTMGYEKLAIVGESGSGKSQTARALLGLSPGKVTAQKLQYKDHDLLAMNAVSWRQVRGKDIAMIMQDPKYSLNPIMRIDKQMLEAINTVAHISKNEALDKIEAILLAVKINQPKRVMKSYPHELSGGMGQRVMIAMMLLSEPELLIADEPTSALDVTVQLEVLAIMDEIMNNRNMGLIFISHDLHLVSTFCDRVLVMYQGEVVESLIASELHSAQHPYTKGLLGCLPNEKNRGKRLPTLNR